MKSLDRTVAPAIRPTEHIGVHFPKARILCSNIPVYVLHDPSSEVIKVEFQFQAGSRYGSSSLLASVTNDQITAGTSQLNAHQIASKIDFYGAYFEKNIGKDLASLSIYSLTKYTADVIRIVSNVIKDAEFPENELRTTLEIKKQRFLINQQKVSHLARKKFLASLYGSNHVYGSHAELDDFERLRRQDIRDFHEKFYKSNLEIFLSGNVPESMIQLLESEFQFISYQETRNIPIAKIDPNPEKRIVINREGAVQSAIRMGKILFDRRHEDFAGMQLLTTVLGGYFGSRLMTNLREDKGFTYGVGAGISTFAEGGYFFISTEVGAASTRLAEAEIWKEVEALRATEVSIGELNTVKSYLLGQIMRSVDGPFATMDRFKGFHQYGLNDDHFHHWVAELKGMTPEKIKTLAIKWLDPSTFHTVIAGSDQ